MTTVYVNRSDHARRYHTDADCTYLPDDPERIRETTAVALQPHYDECAICKHDEVRGRRTVTGDGR